MIWILAAGLFVLPWLEFWLIGFTGAALPLVVIQCLLTGGIGWWFARTEALDLWSALEADVSNHRVPPDEAVDTMLVVLGGWALITPGWITDLLGGALVVPRVREILVPWIRETIRARLSE